MTTIVSALHRRLVLVLLTSILAANALASWHQPGPTPHTPQRRAVEAFDPAWSQPTVEPYIHADFAAQLETLRPTILDAARRHNRAELSGLTDQQFAEVIVLLLHSEYIGWLDAEVPTVRPLHPLFQRLQTGINRYGGADLTIWPTNLRPSVAVEILRGEVPLPPPAEPLHVRLHVTGSRIDLSDYPDQHALYKAISRELSEPRLAIEYLAANLERGICRAHYERVPVTWQSLATWHNQGIVTPADVANHPAAIAYLGRTAAYLRPARAFFEQTVAMRPV
jgi:hypothetical protein